MDTKSSSRKIVSLFCGVRGSGGFAGEFPRSDYLEAMAQL
jgi:hypothetical protein